MTISDESWPPEYTTRRSARAKHIRLSITEKKGLELILPAHVNLEAGLTFLESKRAWIQKHYKAPKKQTALTIPKIIALPAINQSWQIAFDGNCLLKNMKPGQIKLIALPDKLLFVGHSTDNMNNLLPAIKDWLKLQAEKHLAPIMRQLSHSTNLTFNKLSWRFQQTVWGSCTSHKNISLNVKLLFMPPELAKHIILHELCHLKYMSHGPRFWGLMKKHDANYKQLASQSKHIEKTMPDWLNFI